MDTIENMMLEVQLTDMVVSTAKGSDVNVKAPSPETNKAVQKPNVGTPGPESTAKPGKEPKRFEVKRLPYDSWHRNIHAFRVCETGDSEKRRDISQSSSNNSGASDRPFAFPPASIEKEPEVLKNWWDKFFERVNGGGLLRLAKYTRKCSHAPVFTYRSRNTCNVTLTLQFKDGIE
jgi:hypothetical protein